ncbi:unnamed protein product [Trifolium pratense]|uniref:Uncharacterized protein n=1 Tax=Trifolium pratense TaxID=57577 RepID=A0ACB0JF65_TRIPR|nr:unnamed protein product [Trifolium pratense]
MQANGSIQQRQLRFARHEKSNKNSLPSSNIGTIFLPQAKARQAHAFPREGHRSRDSNNLIAKQKPGNPTHEGGSYAQIGAYHAIHAQCKPRPAQAKKHDHHQDSLPSSNIAQFSCHKQKHGKPMHSHERVTESGQQQPYCQAKARQSHPRGGELCTNTCLPCYPCPMQAKACPSQEQHDHHQNSLPSSNIGTIFLPQAKARQAHAFPREGHRVGTATTLLPSKSQAIPPTRVGVMHKYVLTMPNASQGLPKPRTA